MRKPKPPSRHDVKEKIEEFTTADFADGRGWENLSQLLFLSAFIRVIGGSISFVFISWRLGASAVHPLFVFNA
jgi:hypothetical protein